VIEVKLKRLGSSGRRDRLLCGILHSIQGKGKKDVLREEQKKQIGKRGDSLMKEGLTQAIEREIFVCGILGKKVPAYGRD